MIGDVEAYDLEGIVPDRTGNKSVQAAPRNLYETEDGYISLSASSQNIFENVMRVIGRDDLIDDARFETNEARMEHQAELDRIIEEWTCTRTQEEALEQMQEGDAIVGPVYTMADVFDDDHYAARGDLVTVDDESLGTVTTQAAVPKLSETPGEVTHLGGPPGEHNDEVFGEELGLSTEERERLSDNGVI